MDILLASMNLDTPMMRAFSIGYGALSAWLRPRGHRVRVMEVNTRRDLARFEALVRQEHPQVVGFNGPANQAPWFPECVARARRGAPGARVIIGGWQASLQPEQTLRTSRADAVLAGEGELALSAWLDDVAGGGDGSRAPNIWTWRDGAILPGTPAPFIDPLDQLPMVDYGCMDYQGILDVNLRVATLVAGRGCPFACTFCSVGSLAGRGVGRYARMRSVGHVMDEVRYLLDRYQVDHLFFRDDTFTWDKTWALEFCRAMADGPRHPFEILTRADCLDKEMVRALRAAGCTHVWLGVDAGNNELRRQRLHKSTTRAQILEAAHRLQAAGIGVVTTNMVGLPHETPAMHRETIAINREIYAGHRTFSPAAGSSPKIFAFGPFPGTPLHEDCVANGWMGAYPKGYAIYRDTFLQMPGFSRREIMRAYRDFRYQVYRPSDPVHAWLCRLWDHGIGPAANALPQTRSQLGRLGRLARRLVKGV